MYSTLRYTNNSSEEDEEASAASRLPAQHGCKCFMRVLGYEIVRDKDGELRARDEFAINFADPTQRKEAKLRTNFLLKIINSGKLDQDPRAGQACRDILTGWKIIKDKHYMQGPIIGHQNAVVAEQDNMTPPNAQHSEEVVFGTCSSVGKSIRYIGFLVENPLIQARAAEKGLKFVFESYDEAMAAAQLMKEPRASESAMTGAGETNDGIAAITQRAVNADDNSRLVTMDMTTPGPSWSLGDLQRPMTSTQLTSTPTIGQEESRKNRQRSGVVDTGSASKGGRGKRSTEPIKIGGQVFDLSGESDNEQDDERRVDDDYDNKASMVEEEADDADDADDDDDDEDSTSSSSSSESEIDMEKFRNVFGLQAAGGAQSRKTPTASGTATLPAPKEGRHGHHHRRRRERRHRDGEGNSACDLATTSASFRAGYLDGLRERSSIAGLNSHAGVSKDSRRWATLKNMVGEHIVKRARWSLDGQGNSSSLLANGQQQQQQQPLDDDPELLEPETIAAIVGHRWDHLNELKMYVNLSPSGRTKLMHFRAVVNEAGRVFVEYLIHLARFKPTRLENLLTKTPEIERMMEEKAARGK